MSQVSIDDPHRSESSSPNVVWQEGSVDRSTRWDYLGQSGATVWFTGLSGAGKSTLAAAVEEQLLRAGRWAYRLDGDNLRHGVCSDLGFSRGDRSENARRVAEVAQLFADAGAIALVCLVSPYESDRVHARELHERAGIEFVEVYVNTSLAECARRDSKGLYAQADAGTIGDLTGVGAPYEPPRSPDVEIGEALDVDAAAALVLAAIAPAA
jgi:adenylyl-sulfate kinase